MKFTHVNSNMKKTKCMHTSGPPVAVKYNPFTGWFAKAIFSTGPTRLDIRTLEFPIVLYITLATA